MIALYSIAEIRAIERAALAALPAGTLMRRAGLAAAELARTLLAAPAADAIHPIPPTAPRRVLVLAGPGNNGGDALLAAAELARAGITVDIAQLPDSPPPPADAAQALALAKDSSARFVDAAQLPPAATRAWALVIDGLFGIGQTRALAGDAAALVAYANAQACPRLALDVPSGLNADTGTVIGAADGGSALRATHTLTFIANKPGLHTGDGRDHAGSVTVAGLGIDQALFPPAQARLNAPPLFARWLRPRRQNSHKGSHGDLAVIGGAQGMSGAPVLSARAALHCGAGRVFVGFLEPATGFDDAHPELMFRHTRDLDFSAALAIGPGLGASPIARDLVERALGGSAPLVIDADALNLLAADTALRQRLRQRQAPTLLTPHPLEAARLLDISAAEVQADRLAAARALASQCHATVALKGSGSVIAEVDGNVAINPTGNAALATAGTGDVLTGVCGALLAQGWEPTPAALAAVWLHGAAADLLVAQGAGPVGLTASELIPAIRTVLNRAIADAAAARA